MAKPQWQSNGLNKFARVFLLLLRFKGTLIDNYILKPIGHICFTKCKWSIFSWISSWKSIIEIKHKWNVWKWLQINMFGSVLLTSAHGPTLSYFWRFFKIFCILGIVVWIINGMAQYNIERCKKILM